MATSLFKDISLGTCLYNLVDKLNTKFGLKLFCFIE